MIDDFTRRSLTRELITVDPATAEQYDEDPRFHYAVDTLVAGLPAEVQRLRTESP